MTALLIRAALGRRWIADFLTPPRPADGEEAFGRGTGADPRQPPGDARADLAVSLAGPLPAGLFRSDLPGRTADLLEWVWAETVQPYWPRRRRILQADMLARMAQVGQGGWAAALNGMRPGMRWLGDSRLQINAYAYPPREISGAQLLFVPVTPGTAGRPGRSRTGTPWSTPAPGCWPTRTRCRCPKPWPPCSGPARAGLLVRLDTPKSTTQLVALTGQGLGSVGRHLKILLDARLVQRRRAGRSVLYSRTAAGQVLVQAQAAAGERA